MDSSPSPIAPRPKVTRRQMMLRTLGAATAVGAGTFSYAWRVEPHWIDVVRRDLPVAMLPEGLIGKTLVQISDLHIGEIVDEAYMTRTMQRIADFGADILAITGDFMSCDGGEQLNQLSRVMSHLRPARLATIGILGNHDYTRSWSNTAVADEVVRRLSDTGIQILRNQKTDAARDHGLPAHARLSVIHQTPARRSCPLRFRMTPRRSP
jgi:predicted MPP superfamily phosphohydrolase